MSLPLVKVTKYDLLMNNIPVNLASKECLVMLEDTGEMYHWEPNKYIDTCINARIDKYTKLINQMYNEKSVGYIIDLLGNVEGPYENTGYSKCTATINCSGDEASTYYLPDKIAYFYPHFEFTKSDYGVWKIKYEVQPRDTLSEIASAAGSSLAEILKYNPQIKNPNKIMAYDWINLPTGLTVDPEKFAYEFNQRKGFLKNKTYTSRKETIDPYSRMTLKVDGKHTLCLSCGRFIHTPKIGKYNDRYCENCGCYMPETMFGKEKNEKKNF